MCFPLTWLIHTSTGMPLKQWSEFEVETQHTPRKAKNCPYRSCPFSPFLFLHLSDALFTSTPCVSVCPNSWRTHSPLLCVITFLVLTSETERFGGKNCSFFVLCHTQDSAGSSQWLYAGWSWVGNIASLTGIQQALDVHKSSIWSLITVLSNLALWFFCKVKSSACLPRVNYGFWPVREGESMLSLTLNTVIPSS